MENKNIELKDTENKNIEHKSVSVAALVTTFSYASSDTIKEESKHLRKRRVEPIDDTGYEEISVAVLGSVDSGKSTLIGTLVTETLDDGNGSTRSIVFTHPHERSSGRTSDISYQHLKNEKNKRIITFVDLAGHESYLKTTVAGLISNHPDFAFICISDKITKMTKEHIGLCISTGIPFVLLFTKIDFIPEQITTDLINSIRRILAFTKRKMFQVIKEENIDLCLKNKETMIPFIKMSNKSGANLDMIKYAFSKFPKRKRDYVNGFAIENIYNVQGRGTVVSGFTGIEVDRGDLLYLGPFKTGIFTQVRVKSIHNDYRFDIEKLAPSKRGCLCIDITSKDKGLLRKGMVLCKKTPNNVCKKFTAHVKILHHSTTIKPGYHVFANCGMIREPVIFRQIYKLDGQEINDAIRSGDEIKVNMEFMNNCYYLEKGQLLVFREGTTRAVGKILELEE